MPLSICKFLGHTHSVSHVLLEGAILCLLGVGVMVMVKQINLYLQFPHLLPSLVKYILPSHNSDDHYRFQKTGKGAAIFLSVYETTFACEPVSMTFTN